jgi:predicted ATPase
MGTPWRLRLLGGFELDDGLSVVTRLHTRQTLLLLARLALAPERDHPREELAELLWPGAAAESGRNRLREALSSLRRVLEPPGHAPVIAADRRALRLLAGTVGCDVVSFRQALREGRHHDAQHLYRGELLPGFYDDWVLEERRHLAARAEALPAAAPPPVPAAERGGTGLPVYLTRLLGVEAVGAALAAQVRDARLVTLRGPGGGGKTRLAVQVAQALAEAADRPFDLLQFVPLADCHDRAAMADALLLALRQEGGDSTPPLARIESALAGRRALLVLDNVEQLVDEARADIARLAAALPLLHLLLTSRRALGVDGEREVVLPALALPPAEADLAALAANPAVALFVDRARAARTDFQLGPDNHAAVAGIVHRLEGLPLAIELAAARVRSAAPAEMLALLDRAAEQGSGEALHWLSRGGSRNAHDPRHASMLDVVAWSHELLAPGQRRLLAGLAAFRGGAAAAAVAALADGPTLWSDIDELVASSVLRADAGPDGSTRYHPFEPVREFVLQQASAEEAAKGRALQRRAMQHWAAAQAPSPSLNAFRAEIPNLLTAFASALADGAAGEATQIALACNSALDEVTLPPHGLQLLERVAERRPDAALLALLAEQCFESGRGETALLHAEAALAHLAESDEAAHANVLRAAARVLLRVRGDRERADGLLQRALPLARRYRAADTEARLLALQAVLVMRDRDFVRGEALHREALARWDSAGLPLRATAGRVNVALCLGFQHRVSEQLAMLEPALAAAEAQGQWRLLVFSRSVHGYVLAEQKRWPESAAAYRACLQTAWTIGAWREWFYGLWNLPRTLAHLRQPAAAVRLLAFADRFYAERFGALGREDLRERRRTRRLAAVQLGAAQEARCWDEGRRLSAADAQRLAMADSPGRPAPPGIGGPGDRGI